MTTIQPPESISKASSPAVTDALRGPTAIRSYSLALLVLAGLVLVLYGSILKDLVFDWWNNPDYTHGFLVPVFSGYVLWLKRDSYRMIPLAASNFGLIVMFAAIALLFVGTLGADEFSTRISMCVLVAGIVIYLRGWSMLRALAFPLWYLTLAIPLPSILYNQVTFPLQLLASRIAAGLIELTGIPVFREGNLLRVPNYAVEVALACSGIRSLLTLIALAVGYAYVAERRTWARIGLVLLMIPIGVFTNALRITVSSLVGYRFGAEWAEGFLHAFSGWLIYLIALALMFLAHWIIRCMGSLSVARPADG